MSYKSQYRELEVIGRGNFGKFQKLRLSNSKRCCYISAKVKDKTRSAEGIYLEACSIGQDGSKRQRKLTSRSSNLPIFLTTYFIGYSS